MPIGIILNSLTIILGGLIGAKYGHKIPEEYKKNLNLVFSLCAFSIGIVSLNLMKNMPAIILSVVVGIILGVYLKIGERIQSLARSTQNLIVSLLGVKKNNIEEEFFSNQVVTVVVLFTTAATGIYGSLDLGMTGDNTILIVKSIIDFFTAIIFAANLGVIVSVIAIPQFLICIVLFFSAQFIMPLTTPDMISDFKACGGVILLANGFRIAGIKMFPSAELLPAMFLILPFSYIWSSYIVGLF